VRRFSVIGCCFAFTLIVVGACGGAVAPDTGDVGTATSSSASSSGGTSGKTSPPPTSLRDGGVAAVDVGRAVTPGAVHCPDPFSSCTTESSSAGAFACCVFEDTAFTCAKSLDDCQKGDGLTCDENADCKSGACCAEQTAQFRFVTTCRPTCITNFPREQVCTSNADCPGATCKEWNCGGFRMHGIKTCAPLGPCD